VSLVVIAVLAVIWVVALTPMLLRKLSERRLATSVDSFHRQLGCLRRAYPRLAANASHPEMAFSMVSMAQRGARKSSGLQSGMSRSTAVEMSSRSDRVALDDSDDFEMELSPSSDREPALRGGGSQVLVSRPSSRRERRRRVLIILAATVLGFFVLGAIPALRILWDASLLAFGVTAAYVALLIHFHRLAAERAIKVVEMTERRGGGWAGGQEAEFPLYADDRRTVYTVAVPADLDFADDSYETDYDERAAGGR
jgi:hypothetical protein